LKENTLDQHFGKWSVWH